MLPFYEAMYGRFPPLLLDYVTSSSTIASIDDLLLTRNNLIHDLLTNLLRAQTWMCNQANTAHSGISFFVGDWVFVKLQPYRKTSVSMHQHNHKLSWCFFKPFQISEKIGVVAYRLSLLVAAGLHDVFHLLKLKWCYSDPVL